MLTTETNVINWLTNSDYTLVQAKSLLAKHYDLFMDFAEKQLDAEDCGFEILDRENRELQSRHGDQI